MDMVAAQSFEFKVKQRARSILGLRGFSTFTQCTLCVISLDHAATRGDYSEDCLVETARKVADDTIKYRFKEVL